MITIRRSHERGRTKMDWLESYHTFSFGDYDDPDHVGFRKLRVINEDWIAPGSGFPTHAHHDMEILTVVLEGELEHKDSMGNGSVIRAGEVQRMSAGTGVTHSEYNHSKSKPVHLLQIWILPDQLGLEPSYGQRVFPKEKKRNQWCLIASESLAGALKIHQDVNVSVCALDQDKQAEYQLKSRRHGWLQVAEGSVRLADKLLSAGDGAMISSERRLSVIAEKGSEILLFDLA